MFRLFYEKHKHYVCLDCFMKSTDTMILGPQNNSTTKCSP